MPLDLNDPASWVYNTLPTPTYGAIPYWVLADLESYHEEFADNANLTRVLIATPWATRSVFRQYALGFAEYPGTSLNATYFRRYVPLAHPYQPNQYLVNLRKHKIHIGTAQAPPHPPLYAQPDSLTPNGWFFLPAESNGIPPRIVYDAVYSCPQYDVVDQTTFEANNFNETIRFVTREKEVRPRERRLPSFGFETDDSAATPIPEVGFVPYVDFEFTLTWCRVPVAHVPHTAIDKCLLRVNNSPFDYPADRGFGLDPWAARQVGGAYGRYKVGDVAFFGLASKLRPYRDPHGAWLVDLPYLFRHQPADGTGNGMLKVPRTAIDSAGNPTWTLVRQRGYSSGNKVRLYGSWFLDTLFQPEPR